MGSNFSKCMDVKNKNASNRKRGKPSVDECVTSTDQRCANLPQKPSDADNKTEKGAITAQTGGIIIVPELSHNTIKGNVTINAYISTQEKEDTSQAAEITARQTRDLQGVKENHKSALRKNYANVYEGTADDVTPLNSIFTELYVTKGLSEGLNTEHEVWQIEDISRRKSSPDIPIKCNDIFKAGEGKHRTVLTKGIAGIGKTFLVGKFILDWAEEKANKNFVDFIFVLPFRELNLIQGEMSLSELVLDFYPDLEHIENVLKCKVLFIFDGLDESQHPLEFRTNKRMTNVNERSSLDILMTNLIKGNLLSTALIWITSRPVAANRIQSAKVIHQVTEVQGFNDPQKKQYFRRKIKDEDVANRVISHIETSRSFYIMCHLPIFCWIAAMVLEKIFKESESGKIPTTLTEMYTHLMLKQTELSNEKYQKTIETDREKILESRKSFILKLGKLAFEHLEKGNFMFYEKDLKEYDIDVGEAAEYCGLCTEIFKMEVVLHKRKVYCFAHLTIQEFFAALYVFHCFARKSIKSSCLKSFLMEGSMEELKSILEEEPIDLPLHELLEITMYNSVGRKNGQFDLFLRFLVGISLETVQKLLVGLLPQTMESSETVEKLKTILRQMDLLDVSPERCLNLFLCLAEVKDNSLYEEIQKWMRSENQAETQLSPAHCSALAYVLLASDKVLDEFDLQKFKISDKGIFRLIPAVRNCKKAIVAGVWIDNWIMETVVSALESPDSPLRELDLRNNSVTDPVLELLSRALLSPHCKLEALSISGEGHTSVGIASLASALKSLSPQLRELDLSLNILNDSLNGVIDAGLGSPKSKLEKLRLHKNTTTKHLCDVLSSGLNSNSSQLRDLDLSYSVVGDSGVESLSAGLKNPHCKLDTLRLYQCELTGKCCEALASAICSKESGLKELDLSNNDLRDYGVKLLSAGLMNPHCSLEKLGLSFCRVTEEGCMYLASAFKPKSSHLKELDLSYNHPGNAGAKVLSAIKEDSSCKLKKLNMEHNEECWVKLELLRKYACNITLDPNTAHRELLLDNRSVKRVTEEHPYPEHPERFLNNPVVMCEEGLTGRCYWEVNWEQFVKIGMTYKENWRSIDSTTFGLGQSKSWCISVTWFTYSFHHEGFNVLFPRKAIHKCIGVYLDSEAGTLSFYNVNGDTLNHLYTFQSTFSEPLYPAFEIHHTSEIVLRDLDIITH